MQAARSPIKILFASASLIAFAGSSLAATSSGPVSLYERLGGNTVIVRVVDDAIDKTASNPVTMRSFDKVNLVKLKPKLVEHICELTGGPCRYSGDSMKQAHQGLDITEAEFFGMVQELRGALDRAGVTQGAKNELLRILAPMKRDIVSK